MPEHEFKLETTFTDKSNLRLIALGAAIVLIAAIVITMTTGLSEYLLPINDVTLRAMIPAMSDGSEPLSLKVLDQNIEGRKTLHVSGKVENRSDVNVKNLIAVIQPQDNAGKPMETIEAPIEPAVLLSLDSGAFEITAELSDRPGVLTIRFKIADGPYVPHRDERTPATALPKATP